jgi:hypothetical protein
MSTEVLDNLIKQAERLSPDEQMRLPRSVKMLKRILRARDIRPMSTVSQLKNGFPKSHPAPGADASVGGQEPHSLVSAPVVLECMNSTCIPTSNYYPAGRTCP